MLPTTSGLRTVGCRLSAVLVLQLFSCLVGSLAVVSQLVCLPIPVQSLTKKPTSGVCICLLPTKVIPLFVRHYSEYLCHDVCVFMQLRVVLVYSCTYVCAYVHVCLSVHTCVQTYASLRFLCVCVWSCFLPFRQDQQLVERTTSIMSNYMSCWLCMVLWL